MEPGGLKPRRATDKEHSRYRHNLYPESTALTENVVVSGPVLRRHAPFPASPLHGGSRHPVSQTGKQTQKDKGACSQSHGRYRRLWLWRSMDAIAGQQSDET